MRRDWVGMDICGENAGYTVRGTVQMELPGNGTRGQPKRLVVVMTEEDADGDWQSAVVPPYMVTFKTVSLCDVLLDNDNISCHISLISEILFTFENRIRITVLI